MSLSLFLNRWLRKLRKSKEISYGEEGFLRKKKPTSNELVDDHKDKKKDGLSIKDLSTLNKTLLGKWY